MLINCFLDVIISFNIFYLLKKHQPGFFSTQDAAKICKLSIIDNFNQMIIATIAWLLSHEAWTCVYQVIWYQQKSNYWDVQMCKIFKKTCIIHWYLANLYKSLKNISSVNIKSLLSTCENTDNIIKSYIWGGHFLKQRNHYNIFDINADILWRQTFNVTGDSVN